VDRAGLAILPSGGALDATCMAVDPVIIRFSLSCFLLNIAAVGQSLMFDSWSFYFCRVVQCSIHIISMFLACSPWHVIFKFA
jgi:hypothetical protein